MQALTPGHHNRGQPNAGLEPDKQQVAKRLEKGVWKEENGQTPGSVSSA